MSEQQYIENVVDMDQLAQVTVEGWEVVERVEFDEPVNFVDQYPNPDPNAYPHHRELRRTVLGKKVAFRVRKAGSTVISELSAEVTRLTAGQRAADEETRKAKEQLDVERLNHHRTRSAFDAQRGDTERARTECNRIAAIKRQLETDLGKVREHIGRKAFEEILPPPPPEPKEKF